MLPLIGLGVLGAGAYVLGRKHREEQLQKDVAAQSKAAAGFGGHAHRRTRHHGGIAGFGAVGRPAPPLPAVQRTTGIAVVARPAPPVVPVARVVPGLTYGGGWTAASAKAAGERMALANDLAYTGFNPDPGYDLDGYADQSYDRPVAEEALYYDRDRARDDRHRHWY
jgi:hypothetical protein